MTERKTPGEGSAPAGRAEGVAEPSPSVSPSSVPDSVPQQGGEEEKVQAELQDLVAGLERERDEYLLLARRTKADFENYRKRVSREGAGAGARGGAAFAGGRLSVVNSLGGALAAAEPRKEDRAASHIAEGVRLVY